MLAAVLARALTAALILGAAGCSAATPEADVPQVPVGVSAQLVQLRADVAPRQAQLRILNGSADPLIIGAVQVVDARFDGVATRVDSERTSRIPAGATVDVRVQLPPVACAVDAAGESLSVSMEIAPADDPNGALVIAEPITAGDPLRFVDPMHERECRAEALADAARVEFTAFTPAPAGEPASLLLSVTPTAGGATIAGLQRTNLIDFGAATVDGAYPINLAVDAGDETTVIDVPIVPFRCDPHAVQEDKRGTIFDVRVVVDGEAGEIELFVGEDMRGRMLTWVADWCGFAP